MNLKLLLVRHVGCSYYRIAFFANKVPFFIIEISYGDVMFKNNDFLCYPSWSIFWFDIFADGEKQKVFVNDLSACEFKSLYYHLNF